MLPRVLTKLQALSHHVKYASTGARDKGPFPITRVEGLFPISGQFLTTGVASSQANDLCPHTIEDRTPPALMVVHTLSRQPSRTVTLITQPPRFSFGPPPEIHITASHRPHRILPPTPTFPPLRQPTPPLPQNEQRTLSLPECFSRPPDVTQSYTQFDTLKIQDMDDFMENLPSMPVVLMTHDVNHRDWTRFTEDLADAWLCRLSLPNQGGRPPKRSTTAINLVELWNWWSFLACDVELTIYNDRERKNGEYAGIIDIPPPDLDIRVGDSSSGSTGRGPQTLEEVEREVRALDLRGKYAVYLTYLPQARA